MTRTVGIIGFGRFGKLWAELMAPHFDVLVHDVVPVDDPRSVSLEQLCARAQAIFLCVPINRFDDVVQSIRPLLRPGATVLDTCSVKAFPAHALQTHLGEVGVSLIATHPMFGPDSAANGVEGLPMVMWPLRGDAEAFEFWAGFLEKQGIRIVRMSPEEHDRYAAYSQGVTHYVGRLLEQLELEATPIDTAGFRILRSLITQTCNDSWELFHDLQTYNPYTGEMRAKMEKALERLNAELG